jgi:hypothetical protein
MPKSMPRKNVVRFSIIPNPRGSTGRIATIKRVLPLKCLGAHYRQKHVFQIWTYDIPLSHLLAPPTIIPLGLQSFRSFARSHSAPIAGQ